MAYASLRLGFLRVAAALAVAAGLAACGGDGGVLVEITRNEATTPEGIDSLELVVGVGSAEGARFVQDTAATSTIDVSGRDLAEQPYQLLVKNGGGAGTRIVVVAMAKQAGEVVGFAALGDPQPFMGEQVLMRRLTLEGSPEVDVTATGCIVWTGPDDLRHELASPDDKDCDGDLAAVDCDDLDDDFGPTKTDVCGNGLDENCSGTADEPTDVDQDGVTNCDNDCDDNDKAIYPGAEEICDGKDNDCNEHCDDGAADEDGDRYTVCGTKQLGDGSCATGVTPDCNDKVGTINPAADEICDGLDNDCDGTCDVGGGIDMDMDGFSECGTIPGECKAAVSELKDCRDDLEPVHPGATEICDGFDTNCDGTRLGSEPCYVTPAGGTCTLGERTCDDDKADGTAGPGACSAEGGQSVNPLFCDKYAGCLAAGVPDPFACANEKVAMGTNMKLKCTLSHQALALCDNRTAPLPPPTDAQKTTGCAWTIIGGQEQKHYKVAVGAQNQPASDTVEACQATFGVLAKLDFLPRPDAIFLRYSEDAAPQQPVERIWQLDIVPQLVAQCPLQGLSCTIVGP